MAKKLKTQFKVVGIGASAGGLEPLQHIIARLPHTLPHAAIVIAQHLSPDYKSMLVELMARKTNIPVKQVDNDLVVEKNTIYIVPATADAVIRNNTFHLLRSADMGAHPSIDKLFTSIAKEYEEQACGIILSGTGKDGSQGIIAIKKAGGIVIVQEPESARYEGMPQTAIHTGIVDHVLPQDAIGDQFVSLISKQTVKQDSDEAAHAPEETTAMQLILELLEKRIGIDFSDYKTSTLTRRLEKRIQDKKFSGEEEYLEYVRRSPDELDVLFEAILIGVTSFFRDPEAFKKITQVMQTIIEEKNPRETIRIWIPGCATGEEAYTYAIIACDQLEKLNRTNPVQIFATDIDIKALHKARAGIYPSRALQNLPVHLRQRYFVKLHDGTYEVHKDLHKMVLFSRHDVTSNPPFLRLDLISCRNLLIYFNLALQKRVMPLFCYALNPNGYLVLGKSEDVGRFQNLFATIDTHYKIFKRKALEGKSIRLPNLRPVQPQHVKPPEPANKHEEMTISGMIKETLYKNFEHPYIVIDDTMDIIEISGDVSSYLQFKAGTATLNVTKLVHPDIQIELRASLGKMMTEERAVRGNVRKFMHNNEAKFVRISVKPLIYTQPNNKYYLIIFEELTFDKTFFSVGKEVVEQKESPRVMELEQDLEATKEYTNSLLQELETSNEELQAMNEELQSSNEELQASNEELESANEELQATNEELENAYSELREANKHIGNQKERLQRSEENLRTLLNNTQVGFVLIDKDFKVLTFNSIAQEMYNVLFESKLKEGISFIKVLPDTIFPTVLKHIKDAFNGEKVTTEQEIQTNDGKTYHFHLDYTPVERENKKDVSYISLSFLDITKRKGSEEELRFQKSLLEAQQEVSPQGTLVVSPSGKMVHYNKQFEQMWNFPKTVMSSEIDEDALKAAQEQLVDPDKFIKRVRYLYKHKKPSFEELVFKDGRTFERFGSPITGSDGKNYGYVWFFLDITEKKRLLRQREDFIAIATHELKTPVTSLKGYTQVLQNRFAKQGDEKSALFLGKMDTQLNKLTTLIGDLLDVTKIETGKLQFHENFFDFNELLFETVEDMQRTTANHELQTELTESKTLYGDRDRIGQVLINLISNAIKYSPHGEKIIIKTKADKENVTLSVQDFGIGIANGDHKKVFERFYRVNESLRKTYPGLGLGLYISSEIISRHKGKIWVESQKGKGSTFSFSLPLSTGFKRSTNKKNEAEL